MRKPVIRQLSVTALIVDRDVQRGIDRNRVAKIADDLDLEAIGTITVSHRGNGSYHVIDGQHRVEALRLAGGDGEKIDCRIFDGLTIEDEARLFRLLNNTARLQALDKFRVRVVEGEEIAVAINDILIRHGWKLSGGASDGSFSAVAAVERIWNRDTSAVDRTINTITRAWGHMAIASNGFIVEGIGAVYARYGDAIDDTNLADRLARYPGGPAKLIGSARGLKDAYRFTVQTAISDLIVEIYNVNRRTKALPPWRAS